MERLKHVSNRNTIISYETRQEQNIPMAHTDSQQNQPKQFIYTKTADDHRRGETQWRLKHKNRGATAVENLLHVS